MSVEQLKPTPFQGDRFIPFCIECERDHYVVLDRLRPAENGSYHALGMFKKHEANGKTVNPICRNLAVRLSELLNDQPEMLVYCTANRKKDLR